MCTFQTGDHPSIAFGIGGNPGFQDLGFYETEYMTSGCIDAPRYIPAGGHVQSKAFIGGKPVPVAAYTFRPYGW